jgi:hypothetical protein
MGGLTRALVLLLAVGFSLVPATGGLFGSRKKKQPRGLLSQSNGSVPAPALAASSFGARMTPPSRKMGEWDRNLKRRELAWVFGHDRDRNALLCGEEIPIELDTIVYAVSPMFTSFSLPTPFYGRSSDRQREWGCAHLRRDASYLPSCLQPIHMRTKYTCTHALSCVGFGGFGHERSGGPKAEWEELFEIQPGGAGLAPRTPPGDRVASGKGASRPHRIPSARRCRGVRVRRGARLPAEMPMAVGLVYFWCFVFQY